MLSAYSLWSFVVIVHCYTNPLVVGEDEKKCR